MVAHHFYKWVSGVLLLCLLYLLEQTYLMNHKIRRMQNQREITWAMVPQTENEQKTQDNHFHQKELQYLGDIVQRRLNYIQNPVSCQTRRKLQCNVHNCGFGCKINTIAMCLMIAYALNRTVVLKPELTSLIQPISRTCRESKEANRSVFNEDHESFQVVERYFTNVYRPEFFPPSLPDDLKDKIEQFHDNSLLWWVGQFSSFVFRPTEETTKALLRQEKDLGFMNPIVGVHIRRTDKLIKEAKFHNVDEYMHRVEEWINQSDNKGNVQPRIFLATDNPAVTQEIRDRYKNYTLIHNANFTNTANSLDQRRSEEGLFGIIHDIHLLSKCDYLVCTFTSNVCRLAIQLMTSSRGNVTNYGVSLDRGKWNFVGSRKNSGDVIAVRMPHYDKID